MYGCMEVTDVRIGWIDGWMYVFMYVRRRVCLYGGMLGDSDELHMSMYMYIAMLMGHVKNPRSHQQCSTALTHRGPCAKMPRKGSSSESLRTRRRFTMRRSHRFGA